MKKDLQTLRESYGEKACVTVLPEDIFVPWRPLTLSELLEIERQEAAGLYSQAFVENEIFTKCVLDQFFVKRIRTLPAGDVARVVSNIVSYSRPENPEELENAFNCGREEVNGLIHFFASHICVAFPAYKPEDIYDMDYKTMLLRGAMAEAHLLRTGYITEPFYFLHQEESEPRRPELPRRPTSELASQYKEDRRPPSISTPPSDYREIISKEDIRKSEMGHSGHETDPGFSQEQAQKTASIYQDYIDDLNAGRELRIKTPEERKAAYMAQIEEVKKVHAVDQQKQRKLDKEEMKGLLEVQEREKRRKARRSKKSRR